VRDGGAGLGRPLAEILRGARGFRLRPAGRGRGLAIAAAIARRHGGTVSTAPSAEGAALVLALPLLGAPSAVEEQAAR
jgi:signal transduction histidine kinase